MAKKLKITKSLQLWARAKKVIPCATQTLSKSPDQFVRGVGPIYLAKGQGAHVWDVDGNEFIDYPMALGPVILGHAYPRITKAVNEQIKLGTTYTLMHPLEVELAEMLTKIIPCAEMVRFAKNGSDVTTAAVRIARAHTGRDYIAYCGYHGWQDWYAGTTQRNKGIPADYQKFLWEFKYNDLESLRKTFQKHPGKISAVIMEQPGQEPQDNFLQKVIDLTHQQGALFVLDEICTGFRYAMGGAQQYYKVMPDLACFGKAMANGFPISAIVGKKEYMKQLEEVFFSMTFGGETASLRAAIETIQELRQKNALKKIWRLGKTLREGISTAIAEFGIAAVLDGNPPRSGIVFKDTKGQPSLLIKSLFLQETVKRGILFGAPIYISYSHSEADIKKTISACREALKIIKQAEKEGDFRKFLEGEPMGEVFRKRD